MYNKIDFSVIISTYNQPEWLEKVLCGYNNQTFQSFEIVIADDGSNSATAKLIESIREKVSYPIQHIWHEDNGFQKCSILNKAILASKGEYLVFSDGDCIPRKDFLEIHAKYRAPGFFLSGGMFRTTMDVANSIKLIDITSQRCFNIDYLAELGQPRKLTKDIKLSIKSSYIERLANQLTLTRASWNGHNSSGWKKDLVDINGFDERMKYGGEDRELGERLFNKGVKSKQIRYSAICIHLEHKRGYVTEEDWKQNYQIRKGTKQNRSIWTDYGLNKSY